MIVDESHRLSSRYLAPSACSLVFERSPAIWTACLSATLMGKHGLDELLALHAKRASNYVPPAITDQINNHMERVRERGTLMNRCDRIRASIDERASREDLFDDTAPLEQEPAQVEHQLEARALPSHHHGQAVSAGHPAYERSP